MEGLTIQQGLPGSLPGIRAVSYDNVHFQNIVLLSLPINKIKGCNFKRMADLGQFVGLFKIIGVLNVVIAHQVG